MSGPTEGGTVLTLMGSNLGAQVDNVTVKLVNSAQAKEVVCVVDKNQFVPGICLSLLSLTLFLPPSLSLSLSLSPSPFPSLSLSLEFFKV